MHSLFFTSVNNILLFGSFLHTPISNRCCLLAGCWLLCFLSITNTHSTDFTFTQQLKSSLFRCSKHLHPLPSISVPASAYPLTTSVGQVGSRLEAWYIWTDTCRGIKESTRPDWYALRKYQPHSSTCLPGKDLR